MAGNFGRCFGCNGRFLCFEEVVRIDKPEVFASGGKGGRRDFRALSKRDDGEYGLVQGNCYQVYFPASLPAPPLAPGDDDGGFDRSRTGLAIMGAGRDVVKGGADGEGGHVSDVWVIWCSIQRAYSEEQPRVCITPHHY
ncbi:unnamed protein product [Allacma fusca]|uniref:Uncharacterized protein n=1 Tax=Allacma fusca TaxID=39272 RepID=A0A8J2PYF2_9HEXA|nr:unnamed protein product [Allacma fusca]